MGDGEITDTVTIALDIGASIGFLEYLGILPDGAVTEIGGSAVLLLSNDINPNDPYWMQVIDSLAPDEYGLQITVSGGGSIGLGGHGGASAILYPGMSPEDVLTSDDPKVVAGLMGVGGVVVADDPMNPAGLGFFLGPILGVNSSFTVENFGFTIDFEEFEIIAVSGDTVHRISINPFEKCFLPGTLITMADGRKKPIENIIPGDMVLSFDERGKLVPGEVTRTKTNEATMILDFHGTKVTPGHVYWCTDGTFAGQFVTLIDILRSDGAVQREDGTSIRATTGAELGSDEDRFVEAITGIQRPDGSIEVRDSARLRLGTRVILDDGADLCIADLIRAGGGTVNEAGLIVTEDTPEGMPLQWPFSQSLPKPEDYILSRSRLTLPEIFTAAEWEDQRPVMY